MLLVVFCIGSAFQCGAERLAHLIVGRAIGGLGVGAGARAGGRTPIGGHRAGSTQPSEAVINLRNQVAELTASLEGLEKERDFYFSKVCFRYDQDIISCR